MVDYLLVCGQKLNFKNFFCNFFPDGHETWHIYEACKYVLEAKVETFVTVQSLFPWHATAI